MLKLIVSASSCEGDLVVDPFCGSGTTMHAANDLQRKWIGIDQSFSAAKATLTRFRHGLEPMGDYVNKTKSVRHQADLFENLSKSFGRPKTSKTSFYFVVDAALMDSFHDEIIELGKI
jgi:adenine-specific DNA-methyltransferase